MADWELARNGETPYNIDPLKIRIKEEMYLSIVEVKPLRNYEIELTFENDEVKIFDVKGYLETGIFQKLKDKKLFNQVRISFDSIEWPGGIDLDPEILYEKSRPKERIIV